MHRSRLPIVEKYESKPTSPNTDTGHSSDRLANAAEEAVAVEPAASHKVQPGSGVPSRHRLVSETLWSARRPGWARERDGVGHSGHIIRNLASHRTNQGACRFPDHRENHRVDITGGSKPGKTAHDLDTSISMPPGRGMKD
ncbi:uncharacterized protein N7482_004849 [Penicillium canariense]|uniref:Uncharacterized protein n=1 Tax=Penicillium canariense TaxID=189055 RepID=A0A9W9LQQ8_9EURO|nr:uncharacterized protein N7482_004849 [Penicillium canariense]KAJ5169255.1 hypothetical protein N7482_004849 [Penicillium canariense]